MDLPVTITFDCAHYEAFLFDIPLDASPTFRHVVTGSRHKTWYSPCYLTG